MHPEDAIFVGLLVIALASVGVTGAVVLGLALK